MLRLHQLQGLIRLPGFTLQQAGGVEAGLCITCSGPLVPGRTQARYQFLRQLSTAPQQEVLKAPLPARGGSVRSHRSAPLKLTLHQYSEPGRPTENRT